MYHLLLIVIYLSFISLGLPDALLGSVWPSMYQQMEVPVSYAGIISMIIAFGTIVSSLQSDRMTKAFGAGKVTAISVAMTAAALFGFSVSGSFWLLCLWAVPYGLGAGGVDAALNNYVALHYKSRHMSWLHCMWGVGAMTGPYIMGYVLTRGMNWTAGYRTVSMIQVVLTIILFASLPLWKKTADSGTDGGKVEAGGSGTESLREQQVGGEAQSGRETQAGPARALSLRDVVAIPGAKEIMICFFCYCALEQTTGLWASSYLHLSKSVPAVTAAGYASMLFAGVTIGRAISGFVTMKLNDTQMIRLGLAIVTLGILIMLLPLGARGALAGLMIIGFGCAPVYPCIIHSTPEHFGKERSQALIGVQMASAYIGILLMPPLFGLIADKISTGLLPVYLLVLLAGTAFMYEKMIRKKG